MDDTIFALSSAYGKAGVAAFRISGPRAGTILDILSGGRKFVPNEIQFAKFRDKRGEAIDNGMAVFMRAPNSYTGEDTAEIFTHGGVAVIEATYRVLAEFEGARIAEPGEFTKRAFLNGKLDLTQVEAVADLVDAQTEAQRKQAMRGVDGEQSKLYGKWRGELVKILAHAEAVIDFAEDEMPENVERENERAMRTLLAEIKAHVKGAETARMIRHGIDVAIIGRTNAGKSSLFNRMLGMERAIVSPHAGTTRDIIEASLDVAGFKVNLSDTAGLNERASGAVEKKGIANAKRIARDADIKILVIDGARGKIAAEADTIVAFNKIDRKGAGEVPAGTIGISAKTGKGIDGLWKILEEKIKEKAGAMADAALARERHKKALENCALHLGAALREPQADIKAEEIRAATNALGQITGAVYFNELLDEIFSRFCIGK
ncbi:MAG: tRNA uridine-5-carboxymethylaminomethyl(34) synthesis GTPase MnmE [Rickettsiales bacterium]|jgi:tRNA modification GTPase|nr:tRNA uridine-5-carboxymethylaminomethyl(34) synthesis GTPase MnmE [Rickettsiales bacterium]